MVKAIRRRRLDGSGLRMVIIASRYNTRYVDGLRIAARKYLEDAGVTLEEIRVPGSFEIPVAAAVLARRNKCRPDAILCLGVIWQGETLHAQYLGEAVTSALMALQVETGVPCVHEVLTLQTEDQARIRCLDERTNRGSEAAATAVEMGRLLKALKTPKKAIRRMNNALGEQSFP